MLEEKIKNIPLKPGCYIFKDSAGTVLYVGKAIKLRNRVRSYFNQSVNTHPKQYALVQKIRDMEWIVTDSEVEALILENNLIKEHKPRYNISLRDDKSYPYIRITAEDFPQVFITRKRVRDGSQYFGPYTDVKNVRYTLKTLKRIFAIRSCRHDLNEEVIRKRKVDLCLDYHIKKCFGPCQGLQSKEAYGKVIHNVQQFLRGKTSVIVKELRLEMQHCSEKLAFEEAARLRDKLEILNAYRNTQKVVYDDGLDRDILGIEKLEDDACVVLFKIREGKVLGRIYKYLKKVEWKTEREILEQFLRLYYFETEDLPKEIYLSLKIETQDIFEKWLSERSRRRVKIVVPQVGEKKKLLVMAQKNAALLMDELKLQKMKAKTYIAHSVKALQRDLNLKLAPKTMECFDISNIQGTDPVASMVYFENGQPKKSEYRRYKIRVKSSPDDFAMMREVIERRYRRLLDEKKTFPDLIIVDGGKGQLSSAVKILDGLNVKDQQIIGLAKRLEEVFLPGYSDAQMLPRTSSALKLLQQIRDEAHRFAVTFHRERRSKRTLKSQLDEIEGIGPKRRRQLLKTFGSVKKISQTSVQALIEEGKLSQKLAEKVKVFLKH
jgi:excinuclease ABC subunit C